MQQPMRLISSIVPVVALVAIGFTCAGILLMPQILTRVSVQTDRPRPAPVPAAMSVPAMVPAYTAPIDPPFATQQDGTNVIVTDYGIPILVVPQGANRYSSEKRAEVIAARLNDILINDLGQTGRPITQMVDADTHGEPIVFFGYKHADSSSIIGDLIVTVDPKTAVTVGVLSSQVLTCWWRDLLRDWLLIGLGKPPQYTTAYTDVLLRFYKLVNLDADRAHDRVRFAIASDVMKDKDTVLYHELRDLYRTIPAKYEPKPSDIHDPAVVSDDAKGEKKP